MGTMTLSEQMGIGGERGGTAVSAWPGAALDEFLALPERILDMLPSAVYACDADGLIVRFNARAAELWGRAPLIGDTEQRFCGSLRLYLPDGDVLDHAATPMAAVLRTGMPARDQEVVIERLDGSRVTVLVNIDPVFGHDGELVGAINCFQDISERKRTEEALRLSEQRFRDFAAAASDWFWETNAELRFTWFSSNVEDLVGIPREWHYGKTRLELMAATTEASVVEAHRRTLEAREPFRDFQYLRRGPSGDSWLSVSGMPVFDAAGRFEGYRGVGSDISEKKKAEEHRELLVAELSHRVNNTLAVVQAFATQTGACVTTVPEFLEIFRGRLRALATGHTLVSEAKWGAASFIDLTRVALEPYLGDGRLHLDIEDVTLMPELALTLTLAFHELATNSCKFGALSASAGQVTLTARRVQGEGGDDLEVTWCEQGGPAVQPPEQPGFGTKLLVRALEYQHDGRAELDWREEGLLYSVTVPLAKMPAR